MYTHWIQTMLYWQIPWYTLPTLHLDALETTNSAIPKASHRTSSIYDSFLLMPIKSPPATHTSMNPLGSFPSLHQAEPHQGPRTSPAKLLRILPLPLRSQAHCNNRIWSDVMRQSRSTDGLADLLRGRANQMDSRYVNSTFIY